MQGSIDGFQDLSTSGNSHEANPQPPAIEQLLNVSHPTDQNSPVDRSQQDFSALLVAIQDLNQAIGRQRIPNYAPLLSRIEAQLEAHNASVQELQREVSSRHHELSDIGTELQALNQTVQTLEKRMREQQKDLESVFSWKTVATNLLASSLIMSCIVVLIIKLTPSRTDALLDTKLEIMFNRIEQIQKQTSP